MNKVKIGIVGVGNIGFVHAYSIYGGKVGNMELAALCDIEKTRIERCRVSFPGIPVFSNYIQMLKEAELDAVVVAVPHKQHCDIAHDVLNAGLHVLVEKPVDITVTKAAALNKFAKTQSKVFAIMFNQRTNPLFARARQILQSGALGELKRSVWIITNWYRSQHYYDSADWRATWSGEGGGVLLNQAPHNLDLWQWICGMPCEVTAFCDVAKYHSIEVEDDVTIFARYANGATGTFITSTGEYPGTNRLEISGTRGKLVLEHGKLKWYRLLKDEQKVRVTSDESFPEIPAEYEEFTSDDGGSHNAILCNFADAVLTGSPLLSPGIEGINELTISNAAYLSAWKGNVPVTIPINNLEFDQMLGERIKMSGIKKGSPENSSCAGDYLPRWSVNW